MKTFTDMDTMAADAEKTAAQEEELLQGLAELTDIQFEAWVKVSTHHSATVIEAFRAERDRRRSL